MLVVGRETSGQAEQTMRNCIIRSIVAWFIAVWSVAAVAQTADLVLLNGKVVTVDDRFTIAEALAIRG